METILPFCKFWFVLQFEDRLESATSYPGVPEGEEPFVLACYFIGIARMILDGGSSSRRWKTYCSLDGKSIKNLDGVRTPGWISGDRKLWQIINIA